MQVYETSASEISILVCLSIEMSPLPSTYEDFLEPDRNGCSVVHRLATSLKEIADGTQISMPAKQANLNDLLLSSLKEKKIKSSRRALVEVFCDIASLKCIDARIKCLNLLPAVSQAVARNLRSVSILTSLCCTLATDDNPRVRLAFAGVFPDAVHYLATRKSNTKLRSVLRFLMRDSSQKVKETAISGISNTIEALHVNSFQGWDGPQLRNLLSHVFEVINVSEDHDLVTAVVHQMVEVLLNYPSLETHGMICPGLLCLISLSGDISVRISAAIAIVRVSVHDSVLDARESYISLLLRDLAAGDTDDRMIIADCAEAAISIYSAELFGKLFSTAALDLRKDPSSKVRLRLAEALPSLTEYCQVHEEFEPAIRALCDDNDAGVAQAMRDYGDMVSMFIPDHIEENYSTKNSLLYFSQSSKCLGAKYVFPKGALKHLTRVREIKHNEKGWSCIANLLPQVPTDASRKSSRKDSLKSVSLESEGEEDFKCRTLRHVRFENLAAAAQHESRMTADGLLSLRVVESSEQNAGSSIRSRIAASWPKPDTTFASAASAKFWAIKNSKCAPQGQ